MAVFPQDFCDFWLFPAAIVPLSDTEWALEAPSRLGLARLNNESQRLSELLGKTIKFRMGAAT